MRQKSIKIASRMRQKSAEHVFTFGGEHLLDDTELPRGPFRTVFSTESESVVFCYSEVNLLRIVIHYSKCSKSVQECSDSPHFQ